MKAHTSLLNAALPNVIESEQRLLGLALKNNVVIDRVDGIIQPDDLFDQVRANPSREHDHDE